MIGNYPEGVELEDRPCPLGCSPKKDDHVLVGKDMLHGIPGEYAIVRCVHCDLMRTNPRPTAATIGVYYPSDYGPYASTKVAPAPAASAAGWKRKLRSVLRLESRRLPDMAPGRMLEIGCASGSYLAEMRARGWAVEGIEFSGTAVEQARREGLSVQCATVENAKDPEQPVDLVTAWMVLEHLHEPVEALKRIRTWVRPGGYLVASVPDAGGMLGRMFGNLRYDLHLPNHLYHYTPESLEKLLSAAGWHLERVHWQRNCNSPLRSLQYWAEARRWSRLAAATEWVATSRKSGKLRGLLNWLAGATRQSGRIEIWARPARVAPPSA